MMKYKYSSRDILLYLLSFPGCCWINSSRYFLANSMNPFIGLFGLSVSFTVFFAGDIGGDMMEPEPVEDRTGGGRRLAMPCLRVKPPVSRLAPGENCSDKSWLKRREMLGPAELQPRLD